MNEKNVAIGVVIFIILIVIGFLLYFHFSKDASPVTGQGLNDDCSATKLCASGLSCQSSVCKATAGQPCSTVSDCVTGTISCSGVSGSTGTVCVGGTGGGLNQPCPCETGFSCVNGNLCKAVTGQPCVLNADCVSGLCNGTCQPVGTTPIGQACSTSTPCQPGLVCSAGYCQLYPAVTTQVQAYCSTTPGCSGSTCYGNFCLQNSSICLTNPDCLNLNPAYGCFGATGTTSGLCSLPPGNAVNFQNRCLPNFHPSGGKCQGYPNIRSCVANTDCLSGSCNNVGTLFLPSLPNGFQRSLLSSLGSGILRVFVLTSTNGYTVVAMDNTAVHTNYVNGTTASTWRAYPSVGAFSLGAQNYNLLDLSVAGTAMTSTGMYPLMVGIYQVTNSAGAQQGRAVFTVNLNNTSNITAPFNTASGLIFVNNLQIDPSEIDAITVGGQLSVVVTGRPNNAGSSPDATYYLPPGSAPNANWTPVLLSAPAGTQARPRYLRGWTSSFPELQFGVLVNGGVFFSGTVANQYTPPAGGIVDYNLVMNGGVVSLWAVVMLNSGYLLYEISLNGVSTPVVQPQTAYVGTTTVMATGLVPAYYNVGLCR